MLAYQLAYASIFIVTEGLEPSRYFYHKTLILARLPITPHDVILSSGWDSNPHVLSDTGPSTRRVYQFRHLTLFSVQWDSNPHCTRSERVDSYQLVYKPLICYRSEGTRTPNPFLPRPPGLSRCCIPIPITDRCSRSTRIRTQTSGLGNHYASHYKHTPK